MISLQHIIYRKSALLHVSFCMAVLLVFYTGTVGLQAAGFSFGDLPVALARGVLFVTCVYWGRWLCLLWQAKRRVLTLLFMVIAAFPVAGIGWWLALKCLFGFVDAGLTEAMISVLPFYATGIATGVLLKLVRYSVQKEVIDAQAATMQKESELNLLQSQLSPHFLFNTLNNIYAASIDEHEKVPGLLLKLSELLRYSVYDTKKTFVPLKDELDYIKNYIDFEQMRIADRLELKMNIDAGKNNGINIAPMVLVVFIENAFKHSKNTLNEKIYIELALIVNRNIIQFMVKNSYSVFVEATAVTAESSGFGLANTVKRLQLLYGSDYVLQQTADSGWYTVRLQLPVK